MTLIERLKAFEGSDELGNGDFTLIREAAAHIRAQSAEIAWLKMGLAMYASDMAQFDLSKTRTALKEPYA